MNRLQQIFRKLRDKDYREAFVSARVAAAVGAQIAALREKRGWNQEELARRAGMKQPRIALIERGDYESFSFSTLKRLAAAFGVAVRIDFVGFPHFLRWSESFDSESVLAPEPFESVGTAPSFPAPAQKPAQKYKHGLFSDQKDIPLDALAAEVAPGFHYGFGQSGFPEVPVQ